VCLYQRVGLSVNQIARKFGVSWATVHYHLKKAGVAFRPRRRAIRPPVTWRGRRYHYVTGKRCYVSYARPRTYLARDVWAYHHGPIPDGCQVRHRDGDPSNNALENLVCVSPSDGSRLHSRRKEDEGPPRFCLRCGQRLERKRSAGYRDNAGLEPFHQFVRRRYCGLACSHADQKGRPRHWSPDHPVERDDPVKHCLACGKRLVPRVQRGGKWDGVVEPPSAFARRQCCNPQCAGAYRRRQQPDVQGALSAPQ